MGCHHNLTWKILSFVFLVILSVTQQRSMAQGRANLKPVSFSKTARGEEDGMSKVVSRARIGSRPPRCDRRCSWCGNCEAIQVPTNPQAQTGKKRSPSTSTLANVNNDRGDDYSNYKPMSWKCKCGNFIFNP